MHSYLYDTQKLEKILGGPLPHDETGLPQNVQQDPYLKMYYALMIKDINRRKVEAKAKKRKASQPQRPDPTNQQKKKRNIREHNAPRGVEYQISSGEFTSKVTVSGEVLEIPSSTDPDVVLKRRKLVEEFIAQNAHSSADKSSVVPQLQGLLQAIATAQAEPPLVPEAPELQGMHTPIKPISTTTTNPGTPLTAPHKLIGQTDIDVLRFRHFYYCRFSVFSEYISTPMRFTRQEADNDSSQIRLKLRSLNSIIKNPLTSSSQTAMEKVREDLKSFASSLDGSKSAYGTPVAASRTAQTEIKPVRNQSALPEGVYRVREKYYTTVKLFGGTFATPNRSTIEDVLDDKEFFLSEAAKRSAVTEADSQRVIDEIKRALQRHEQTRTPRKSV